MQVKIKDKWLIITGTEEEKKKLKNLLTFQSGSMRYTKAYKYGGWDGRTKLYIEKDYGILIRSGLLDWLKEKFIDLVIPAIPQKLDITDDYWKVITELRDYQEEAVIKLLQYQRGILLVPTSGGKTLIATAVFKGFDRYKVIYIVHRVELLQQVKGMLEEELKEDVGLFGNSNNSIDKRITVGMVQSLYSSGKMNKEVQDWMETVKVLIVDEAHHCKGKQYQLVIDMFKNASVKIGMTGTLPESEEGELKIIGLLGRVLYEVDSKELSDRGYITVPEVKLVQGDWDIGVREHIKNINWQSFTAGKMVWDIVKDKCIIHNEQRNMVIKDIVNEYRQRGEKGILVVVDYVEHGEILHSLTNIPLVWSGKEDRKELFHQFKKEEIDALICSPVLEEGVDITGIRTIVLAGGGKSKTKLLQRIGRGMRLQKGKLYCQIIDFCDNEIPMLCRHTQARVNIYMKQGYKLVRERINK